MKKLDVPIVVQPGSQPTGDDGVVLDYLDMPSEVWTYAMPRIPEPEEISGVKPAIDLLEQLRGALQTYQVGTPAAAFSLDGLNAVNVNLINQVFGHGEVSIRYQGPLVARIQESVLAGVWRVQYLDTDNNGNERVSRDVIEVAGIPSLVWDAVFNQAAGEVDFGQSEIPEQAGNAAALLTEINVKLLECQPGTVAHVINLSLLPHTDEDIEFLTDKLGSGPAVILSRGYGNCRITSTGTRNVWWVQYFNSQDTLILNTIEITRIPEVACAAQEDIDDSAQRLEEILEVYR